MNISNYCRWLAKKGINTICFIALFPTYFRPKRAIEKSKINQILLINLQGIGDIVMTTPFLTALRKEFLKAEIHYLCYKGNGDVLEGDKRINKILKRKEDNIFSKDFLNTIREIRSSNYDLIINLFPAQHSALITVLSNAKYKLGNLYSTASTSNNLKIKKAEKTWDGRKNAKNIAEQLELQEYNEAALSITISSETKKEIEEFFKNERINRSEKCIGINPNAMWISKNWPDEYWCMFIEQLLKEKEYKKYQIVLFGGPGDKEHTEKIKEIIAKRVSEKEMRRIINIAGKLNLKQTAAALQAMSLFITTDSGLLHIACAGGTKTIGLFGCTNPDILVRGNKWVEIVSSYSQCPENFQFNHNNEPPDQKQECMQKISVEEVFEKVKRII
ncbi:MAG: glycosyltransferase family 9 protein [Nanoarchaeota archaeon]